MMISELADLLNDANIGLTVGTNLFVGELGQEFENAVVMVTTPSARPDNELDTEYQVIDFYSRYSNSEAGYNMLREIYDYLHRATHYELANYNVYLSEALGQIDDLDRDAQKRKIWKLSINFIYHSVNNIS
jgi:hypothetical protein